MGNQVILIDGKNMLYRHHYVNTRLTNDEGHPTGALHGCLNSMIAIARRLPEASFVWVWDGEGGTWRHQMMKSSPQVDAEEFEDSSDEDDITEGFATKMATQSMQFLGLYDQPKKKAKKRGYKANRIYGDAPKRKDKYPTDERQRALLQVPLLRLILHGCGFRQFEVQGLECDDLLAMLAKRIIKLDEDADVIIHSGDRDYYQLLDWPQVKILLKLREGKMEWVGSADVFDKYGVEVNNWTKYRALTGDASDNIPHLWKVGPKTAMKMLDAGFDPSNSDHHHIDKECREKFKRYFPHGLSTMWKAVYGNYKLCQLVSKIDDPLLSDDVQQDLDKMFGKLTSMRKFQRKASQMTQENWRKVTVLLSQYELHQILSQRDELWSIP